MNERCFQFYILKAEVREGNGTISSSKLYTETVDDTDDIVNQILEKWGRNTWEFFGNLDVSFRQQGFWPWAIVLYQKELKLAGHVVSIRKSRNDFSFTSYSMKPGNYSVSEQGVPPFSVFLINNKVALEQAAKQSVLFEQAWTILKDKDETLHWICIAESPPEDWVNVTSVGDDELFLKTISY